MNNNLKYIKSIFQEKFENREQQLKSSIASKGSKFTFLDKIFEVVPFVIYVMDLEKFEIYFTSKEIQNLIGYSPREFEELSINLLDYIHPIDKEKLAGNDFQIFIDQIRSFNNKQLENSRFSKNYRLKHKNGNYIHCLDQSVILNFDKNEDSIIVIGILMDITQYKNNEEVVLSISEYTPEMENQLISTQLIKPITNITEREKEILILLFNSKTSNYIAQELEISIHTVNTHRSNLLQKFNCNNTKELLRKVRIDGIV